MKYGWVILVGTKEKKNRNKCKKEFLILLWICTNMRAHIQYTQIYRVRAKICNMEGPDQIIVVEEKEKKK